MADTIQYTQLKAELAKLGPELVAEIRNELIKADKVATGDLIGSINFKVVEILGTLALSITGKDYLTYVISGRKPNRKGPPQKFIRKWIDKKPIGRFRDKKGRFISKDSQAFIISRSIGKKGIKPVKSITLAQRSLIKRKSALLASAMGKDLMNSIKNILINK